MTSLRVAPPTSGLKEANGSVVGVDKLPDEINDMKIRDDKVSCDCCHISPDVFPLLS